MILRPRQKQFVERCIAALGKHNNTLGVAPTGAGKTIMLSGLIGELLGKNDAKACVLAHRDELTSQNESKFCKINPSISTSIVDAKDKNWHGQTTFAMVQTLSREQNIAAMPQLDVLVIDEAHHARADSYRRIIDHAYDLNPDLQLIGVTATPNRGDRRGLRPIFNNVGDQICIGELILSGHLVSPRTFVIDVGAKDALLNVKRTAGDFDMADVDAIMNQNPITDAVIKHWKDKAGKRKTVVFCSTIDHAQNVTDAFNQAGIAAVIVHGELSRKEREAALYAYEQGDAQVIVNVAVLTEGWDYQPTSCVILLRPSSYKSTMIQMVGRGLRTVDPELFPGIVKTDCIVLDFGTASLMHGSLEQDINLIGVESDGEAPTKDCPECGAEVPIATQECSLCGYVWEKVPQEQEGSELGEFVMSEIDLLKRSSFRWCDLFGDESSLLATGFNAWSGIFYLQGQWHAVGGLKTRSVHLLSVGERLVCLAAANDWLNDNETDETAHKTRSWHSKSATAKQLQMLPPEFRNDFGMTRYQAAAQITFHFNKGRIQKCVRCAA